LPISHDLALSHGLGLEKPTWQKSPSLKKPTKALWVRASPWTLFFEKKNHPEYKKKWK